MTERTPFPEGISFGPSIREEIKLLKGKRRRLDRVGWLPLVGVENARDLC